MLTAKDIDLMKSIFLTKEDKKDFLTKKEFMIEMADHPTNQDFADYRQELNNNILNFKELRQETDINSSFRGKIEKQDKRLDRLESAVFS